MSEREGQRWYMQGTEVCTSHGFRLYSLWVHSYIHISDSECLCPKLGNHSTRRTSWAPSTTASQPNCPTGKNPWRTYLNNKFFWLMRLWLKGPHYRNSQVGYCLQPTDRGLGSAPPTLPSNSAKAKDFRWLQSSLVKDELSPRGNKGPL